jgi:hypothetical protein
MLRYIVMISGKSMRKSQNGDYEWSLTKNVVILDRFETLNQ